jgi:hypothetical protein
LFFGKADSTLSSQKPQERRVKNREWTLQCSECPKSDQAGEHVESNFLRAFQPVGKLPECLTTPRGRWVIRQWHKLRAESSDRKCSYHRWWRLNRRCLTWQHFCSEILNVRLEDTLTSTVTDIPRDERKVESQWRE